VLTIEYQNDTKYQESNKMIFNVKVNPDK